MTVRLEKRSLLLGLVAALGGVGVTGCSSPDRLTDLDPEGPPRILQVFVRDRVEGFKLSYGVHRDVYRCAFGNVCDEGLTCADSGEFAGHCVDGSGNQPRTENAIVRPAQMRIISKELLDGSTVEHFLCACGQGCPVEQRYSTDAYNCSTCGDNPATTTDDESGRCLDADDDTLADFATLKPNIATITCGSLLAYTAGINDGFYYPSGNQFPSATQGTNALGPAIVLVVNGDDLPTSTECTVALTPTVKDKDGEAFEAPSRPIAFRTEALAPAAGRVPAPDAEDVDLATAMVVIPFNTRLKADTITAANVTVTEAGGAAITATPALATNQTTITVPLAEGTLKPETEYTVTVSTGVQDKFGQALPAAVTYSFTTAAAEG